MKSFAWVLSLALFSANSVLCAKSLLSTVKKETNLPRALNKFIVEIEDLSDIGLERSLVGSPHEFLYAFLRRRAVGFDVTKEFDAKGLFVGAVLTLNNPQDVNKLASTPGVKAIRAVRSFPHPNTIKSHIIAGPDDPQIPPDTQSTHIMTGVDKLHAQGITGKGIKVGILDTGIDYTHPALGGGFGPGHKVIGGFDLVGDDYDGTNAPKPDPDPLDQCAGHGTHVAGIIAADPRNKFNISGVAYDASLTAYRVFGCVGSVTDDVLVDALLMGFKDGQDILTLSIGGAGGWTESSSAVVASRIAASGKIVTIAAGNDGRSGSWYTSSPGNGIDVISVASVDNTLIPVLSAIVGGVGHGPIIYYSLSPLPAPGPLPIFATSNVTTIANDACNPLPDSIPDLSPFIVVIRRGGCTFATKLANAVAKGTKIALIYDNGSGFAAVDLGNFTAAVIQAADGEFLVSQFAAGAPVTVSFPPSGSNSNFQDPHGGLVSIFSSYGPSNDFFFKPAVGAPGGNILSTLPVNLGTFGVKSGTSMATPFVAGSAALLFSAIGNSAEVGRGARTLFETTAQRIPFSQTDGDPLQTVTQQGAGLINVFEAIHATTVVSPGELILNDTAHFKNLQRFTVRNTAKVTKEYVLTHVPAGTAVTVTPGTIFPAVGPVPLTTAAASVSLSQNSFTLHPGQTETIIAHFRLPNGDVSTFPVFSGFIQITSGTERLHVTYIGLGASLKDKQVVDNTDVFFGIPIPAILDPSRNVQGGPRNYTFTQLDFPTVLFRMAFGTPLLRLDLVDANIESIHTLNTRANTGLFFSFPRHHGGGTFNNVNIVGPLAQLDFLTRNNEDPASGFNTVALPKPTFANATTIPNGSYRILLRALRVTGDATREEDYESFISPVVGITA